jgi:ABC-type multidrug transport system fused ATPase/permease subunit
MRFFLRQGTGAAMRIFTILHKPPRKYKGTYVATVRVCINKCQLFEMLSVPSKGNVKFEGVSFAYPSRPETVILDNIKMNFEEGKRYAIVGPSGSGKSSILSVSILISLAAKTVETKLQS